MQDEQTNIHLVRSDEMQELIGAVPHWILRYGITMLLVIISSLFIAAYFLQYPDALSAKVTITATNPPSNIIAKTSGKITRLFIKDNEAVTKGELLAVLENTAVIDSIEKLKLRIERNNIADTKQFMQLQTGLHSGEGLGELTPVYEAYETAVKEYQFTRSDPSDQNKISSIDNQIFYQQRLVEKLTHQSEIVQNKYRLETKKYESDKKLAAGKIIAPMEINESEKKLLDVEQQVENSKVSILNTTVNIEQQKKAILELQQGQQQKIQAAETKLRESFQKLQTELANWEQKYLLKSPMDGKVTFFKFWSENQNVTANDVVFTIVSPEEKIFGKAFVPIAKSAKMKVGQSIKIKIANYPYEQYGMLIGTVSNISEIPIDDNYMITIEFPNGLLTSYKKKLLYYPEMKGEGHVILKEERLLSKFFIQFHKMKEDTK